MTQQDEDSYSDNSDSVEVKINWESLKGKLSAGALEALQQHVQDPAREQPNAASTEDVGEDTIARYSSDSNSNGRGALLPDSNKAYKLKEYWDDRFKTEEHYDWLANYADIAEHVREVLPKTAKVLVVGCGNSSLSADMYDDGYRDLLSTDFSLTVVEKMRSRNYTRRPGLRWAQMDMLALDLEDASVDAVIDKAAMDSFMVDKGDPWNPSATVVEQAHEMCCEVSRVLVTGGVYIQLSFEQAHFRKKLLLGEHRTSRDHHYQPFDKVIGFPAKSLNYSGNCVESSTTSRRHEECRGAEGQDDMEACEDGGGGGDSGSGLVYGWHVVVREIHREGGCFGHFLYIMRKKTTL